MGIQFLVLGADSSEKEQEEAETHHAGGNNHELLAQILAAVQFRANADSEIAKVVDESRFLDETSRIVRGFGYCFCWKRAKNLVMNTSKSSI